MAKKVFTDESLSTFVDEIKSYTDDAVSAKANSSHNHAASNITSGTLSSDRLPTVPIAKGGTGATTAAAALTNLGAAAASHTHNYAGASSAGGAATSANKLNTDAGSATNPVYFSNGIPVKTTYTLGKSVPSNAVFTDTTYSNATTTADGLMSLEDKTKLNATNIAYGTCATAAATAAKVITISGNTNWTLAAGSLISIKFTYTNTASNPTFNVNGTGAKSVWYNTALITTGSLSYAGYASRTAMYMYDGTQYVFQGWSLDNASDTKVTQAYSTTSASYPLLMSATSGVSSTSSRGAKTAIVNNQIYANPSTGALTATSFVGDLTGDVTGNASTATTATKVGTSTVGSATQPVYISSGTPTKCTYTLGASVPSGAVFTDTVYTHPTYTARTGKPTANQTPAFGGTATVSQITSDATGHVTGATDRTITIPSTLSNGTGTAGLIKTSSTVTSASGYTACPVISGVPYYKDTNTTYTSLKNPYSLTIQGNGTTLTNGTYDGSAAKTVNITASAIGAASSGHDHLNGIVSPAAIELTPASTSVNNGGYIDFHYNASTDDYTSRIIENASGSLQAYGSTFKVPDAVPTTAYARNILARTASMAAGDSMTSGRICLVIE